MIRIVHLITSLNSGGAEHNLLKLCQHLDRKRYQQVVISLLSNGTLEEEFKKLRITVYTLSMKRGRFSLRGLYRLYKLLKEIQPHILQTWLYHADLIGLFIGKLARVPIIGWNIRCSDMNLAHYPWTTNLTLRLLAFLSRFPDYILTNSKAGRQFHEKIGYRNKNWQLIENGIDTRKFRPDQTAKERLCHQLNIPKESFLVGHVARFDPMKDHHTFLKAAQIALKQSPNLLFIMIGSEITAKNPELMKLMEDLHLQDHCYLLGPKKKLEFYYAAFDVFCLTSKSEGFPNVVIEAMACGTPVVSTNVGDVKRVIENSEFLVPPQSPELLAQALKVCTKSSKNQIDKIGLNNRNIIENNYSLDGMIDKLDKFYHSIIKS